MLFALSKQLIDEFLNEIKDELVNYLRTENRNASGRSEKSLQVVSNDRYGYLIGFSGIEYVFRGRGPGGMPPISQLIDWCNSRGLPRAAAWSIARKISIAGTRLWREGRNVLNEVITEEKIGKLKESILVTFTAEIKTEINSLIAA